MPYLSSIQNKLVNWRVELFYGAQRKWVPAKFSAWGEWTSQRHTGRWIFNSVFRAWLRKIARKKKKKLKEECFQRNKYQGWLMMDLGVRTTTLKASQWVEEWGWLTDQSTRVFGQQLPAGSDTPGFPLSGHERLPLTVRNGGDPCHGAAQRKLVNTAQGNWVITNGGRWLSHMVAPRSGEFWWPSQQHLSFLPDDVQEFSFLHITHIM